MEEALTGAVGGAVVASSKILVKHPLDTVAIRLQLSKRRFGNVPRREVLFQGLYDGVVPPLLFAIPSGSIFFSVKDVVKSQLKSKGASKEVATLVSVFVAQFPYWLVRNPSELIKTRAQGADILGDKATQAPGGLWGAAKAVVEEEGGVAGLYQGYGENIAAAFPADALKFLIYEVIKYSPSSHELAFFAVIRELILLLANLGLHWWSTERCDLTFRGRRMGRTCNCLVASSDYTFRCGSKSRDD
jgi:hypothetical protein